MQLVSASEVERFAYCPLSWWLAYVGRSEKREELDRGEEEHRKLYRGAQLVKRAEERMFTSEFMVAIFATAASILAILGIGVYLTAQIPETFVAMLIAAVWLVAAAFFLFVSLKSAQIAREKRKSILMPEGAIVYIGSPESEDLRCDAVGLVGKPDYIVRANDEYVPVEVKTGRSPRGPLYSHILQLACYCMLVESVYGERPPYGVLSYANRNYNIDYTHELQDMVLDKLKMIREHIEKSIPPHRDHKRYGRCKNCSRNNVCPERLL